MRSQTFRYTTLTVAIIVMVSAFVFLGSQGKVESSSLAEAHSAAGGAQALGEGSLVSEKAAFQQMEFDAPVLKTLQETDLKLPGSFTVTFEMSIPTVWFDPDQGTTSCQCMLTYLDGVRALSVESPLTESLVYRPQGDGTYQDMDYEEDGTLLVWHSARKYCLSAGDINRALDEQELYFVHPWGAVTLDHVHTQVYEYRVGSEENVHEFEKFRLATGRGFSKHLRTLNTEPSVSQGAMQTLDVRGVFGPSLKGDWAMKLDVEHDRLVREAEFWSDNSVQGEGPAIRVDAYGDMIVGSDPALASAGVIEYGQGPGRTYPVEFNVLDYSTTADEEHLASIRQLLENEIPESAEVIDYTGPVPQRYPVSGP